MLENETIRLRALEIKDLDVLYKWENNPDNWKVSHTVAPYSRQVLMQYIHEITDVYTDKQLRLIIERKDDRAVLGAVDLFDCDFKNKRAGIGILIAEPAHRGQGYASAVLHILLAYCFDTLTFHTVYCNILADNGVSLALFDKFGFERIGLKKEWTWHEGRFHDEWLLQKRKDSSNFQP